MTNEDRGAQGYSSFLAGLFELLSRASSDDMRAYAKVARNLNPDVQEVLAALATFSERQIDGVRPKGLSAPQIVKSASAHYKFIDQVDRFFRDPTIFPHNEDLMAFLDRRFGMKFGTSSYSRTSILKRFARHAKLLTDKEQMELLEYLRTTNVANGSAPKEHSFIRAWTDAIASR